MASSCQRGRAPEHGRDALRSTVLDLITAADSIFTDDKCDVVNELFNGRATRELGIPLMRDGLPGRTLSGAGRDSRDGSRGRADDPPADASGPGSKLEATGGWKWDRPWTSWSR